MNSRQSSEFAADPVTAKPTSKAGLPDPVSPPFYADVGGNNACVGATTAPLLISEGYARDSLTQNAYNNMGLSAALGSGGSSSSFQAIADTYNMSPGAASPSLASAERDWQQHNQYQQLLNQQALLNQLQTKIQLGQSWIGLSNQKYRPLKPLILRGKKQRLLAKQGLSTSPQQALQQQSPMSQHASLLSQQLHTPAMPEAAYPSLDSNRVPYPHPPVTMTWPRVPHPRSPPAGFAGSPSPPTSVHSLPDNQGLKHSMGTFDDRKNPRAHLHGSSSIKGRPLDIDSQGCTIDKLCREVSRLQSEVDRLEKEVARQKSLRETERIEFTDAKDRVRHSWAVDRDDFARVKSLLKTKNAEHHAQSGRLSQQLKEAEAVNRGLKEICARHGISVPPELEVIHSRRHSLSPGQRSSMSMPSLPSSQISGSTLSEAHSTGDAAMVSRTPSEASYDSDFLERLAAARVSVGNPASSMPRSGSQPPSPVSPATAVLQIMQQLQQVIPSNADNANFKVSPKSLDPEDTASELPLNDAATQAAAQAAAALSQLATALSTAKLPFENMHSSRSTSPHGAFSAGRTSFEKHLDDQSEGLGQFALTDTNLNRMSLQSWVKPSNRPSQSPSESSRSCSPRRASGDGSFDRKISTDQVRLAGSEGPQFSLNAQSSGNTSHATEEIQMWPPSPSQPLSRPVETLHKPHSLSDYGSSGQQEGSWLAKHSEGGC